MPIDGELALDETLAPVLEKNAVVAEANERYAASVTAVASQAVGAAGVHRTC